MKSEDFWYVFYKSGKIDDYIKYNAIKQEEKTEEAKNEVQHKGSYPQRTEYRWTGQACYGADGGYGYRKGFRQRGKEH